MSLCMDPLIRLPYEVGLECLFFASSYGEWRSAGPLSYLMVSTHWQKTILEAPILWTYLVLGDGGEDEAAKVETFLQMSIHLPLDVEIIMSQNTFQSLEVLDLCKSRIKSFVFSPPSDDVHQELVQYALLRGPFPLVTMIWLDESVKTQEISETLGLMCPQLRFLRGARIYSMIRSSPSPPLPLESYALPSLQIVFLSSKETQIPDHMPPYETQIPDTKPYQTYFSQIMTGMASCTQELKLASASYWTLELLSHVAPLSNLRSLQLNPSSHQNWPLQQPSEFPVLVHLRSFSITFPDLDFPDLFQRFVSKIIKDKPLAHLDEFHLLTTGPDSPMVNAKQLTTLITEISNVKSLTLQASVYPASLYEEDKREGELIHMEKLLNLSSDHFNIMRFLYIPNLRKLQISCTLIPEEIILLPRPSFGQNLSCITVPYTSLDEVCSPLSSTDITQSFPVLTSIHLIGSGVCRPLIHLTSIVSVSFDWMPLVSGLRKSINCFLHDLIRHPHNLPHLRYLSFGVFPMWELLFHAVHSRFLKNLAPINRITFSFCPVWAILVSLVQCLQGQARCKMSHRFDTVISRRLSSQYRPCSACLYAGHEDCSWEGADSIEADESGFPISLSEVEFPEETDNDSSSGYWERVLYLEMGIWGQSQDNFEYDKCKRYHPGRSVDVTQDMPRL